MKQEITLTLPYPPSVNEMYTNVRGRGRALVAKGRKFKKAVADILTENNVKPNFSGDIGVTVFLYRPRKAGDLDNYLKAVLDSMQGRIYKNDRQVAEIFAVRLDDKTNPRAEVTVREM